MAILTTHLFFLFVAMFANLKGQQQQQKTFLKEKQ
jgi:hypothetical protein